MNFHIVSDSSCDLGRERLQQLGVDMVSYYVALGDEVYYREERDISTHDFYQKMADNPGVFPKTSMPTLEDYLKFFLTVCLSAESSFTKVCRNALYLMHLQLQLQLFDFLFLDYPHACFSFKRSLQTIDEKFNIRKCRSAILHQRLHISSKYIPGKEFLCLFIAAIA